MQASQASGGVSDSDHLRPDGILDGNWTASPWCRLLGHQGVVFGIAFSEDRSRVGTVSDDRSVRIWELPAAAHPLGTVGEHAKPSTVAPVHTLYGHVSRVWRVEFVTNTVLLSGGEDARCCVWDVHTGALLRRFHSHEGKHIW